MYFLFKTLLQMLVSPILEVLIILPLMKLVVLLMLLGQIVFREDLFLLTLTIQRIPMLLGAMQELRTLMMLK